MQWNLTYGTQQRGTDWLKSAFTSQNGMDTHFTG